MRDIFLSFGCQIIFLLPIVAIACFFQKKVSPKYLSLVFILMFADFMLIVCARKVPFLQFESLNWNWAGKVASIVLSLSILSLSAKVRVGAGFTWLQKAGSLKLTGLLLGVLFLSGIFIGFMNKGEAFSSEAFAFQLLMPSLSEEIMLRGIVFFLFANALKSSTNSNRASMWAALIVTSWFAIIHAVVIKGGEIQFDPLTLIIVFIIGSVLMGLRLVSGSLVFPVVGHSLYNLLIHLVAVFM